jgi:hypothetical protein
MNMTLSRNQSHAESPRAPTGPSVQISASGERRRTADTVGALRAGERDGYGALGKELLRRLGGDGVEMRDVDDRRDCRDSERARRIEMSVMLLVTAAGVASVRHGAVIDTLDDRRLVRAERQLQAVGLRRGQHETDRQKRARHQ